MKKTISAILALLLASSALAGCGDSKSSSVASSSNETTTVAVSEAKELEPVTLRMVLGGQNLQKDHNLVMDKFNELLKEKLPNTVLEVETYADYKDRLPLFIASGEAIDIAWTGYMFDMVSEIKKGAYLPLDDLVNEYAPTIQDEKKSFESDYNTGVYKDVLYALPIEQPAIKESFRINIPTALKGNMDIEALLKACQSSPTTTQAVYDELTKYLEKSAQQGKLDKGASVECIIKFIAKRGFDSTINSNVPIVYKAFDDKIEIQNFYATDEYKNAIKTAAEWFQKSYVRSDILTMENTRSEDGKIGGTILTAHNTANWFNVTDKIGVLDGNPNNITEGYYQETQFLTDKSDVRFLGSTVIGSCSTYTAIPSSSENPERAMMLINLLHSEDGKELYNMLCFGIEGTHYNKTGDNTIAPIGYVSTATADSPYGLTKWMVGNVYNAFETPDVIPGLPAYCLNFKKNVESKWHKTPVYGLVFDSNSVKNEILQINTVVAEFDKQLFSGALPNYEEVYDNMMAKFKSAGIDKVITELQKQADEYVASKK